MAAPVQYASLSLNELHEAGKKAQEAKLRGYGTQSLEGGNE